LQHCGFDESKQVPVTLSLLLVQSEAATQLLGEAQTPPAALGLQHLFVSAPGQRWATHPSPLVSVIQLKLPVLVVSVQPQ